MRTASFALGCSLAIAVLCATELGLFESHADVGKTPKSGTTEFDAATKTYRVTGGGANIWLKEDAFQFAYKRVSGDITFSANVAFQGKGVETHRKAALMIRQSLDADAAYADIAVHGDGMTALQYRPGAGVETSEFRLPMHAPHTITIERRGNEMSVSATDGIGKPVINGPIIVTMQDPVYVGLAVCSHNAGVLETAVFSDIRLKASAATARLQLMPEHGSEGLPLQ